MQVALRRRAAGKRDGVLPVRLPRDVPFDLHCVVHGAEVGMPTLLAHSITGQGGTTHDQCLTILDPQSCSRTSPSHFTLPLPISHSSSLSHTCPPLLTPRIITQGETVPYIICVEKTPEAQQQGATTAEGQEAAATTAPTASHSAHKPLAERAYHPEELRESGGRLAVDVEYYLGQQVGYFGFDGIDIVMGTFNLW